MASDVRPPSANTRQPDIPRIRAHLGQLQTKNLTRNPRYSYQETPVEMQGPTFPQFSSPTNSTIDESPISTREEYIRPLPRTVTSAQMQAENIPERTASPYGLPAPQQLHPAYYAPLSHESDMDSQQQARIAVSIPPPIEPKLLPNHKDIKSPSEDPKTPYSIDHKQDAHSAHTPAFAPPPRQATQIYAPESLGGPNSALENHRPGQVAHPNSAVDPEWKHGLCDPDSTCCLSLFCPCIVYGKTQYRLSRKAQKQDPTDLLGYESFNGSCGFMALACGFQCMSNAEHESRRDTNP